MIASRTLRETRRQPGLTPETEANDVNEFDAIISSADAHALASTARRARVACVHASRSRPLENRSHRTFSLNFHGHSTSQDSTQRVTRYRPSTRSRARVATSIDAKLGGKVDPIIIFLMQLKSCRMTYGRRRYEFASELLKMSKSEPWSFLARCR